MAVLTTKSTILRDRLALEKSWNSSSIGISQSMSSRHTCLCCSNLLLRHICSGKLYWRCSHCYQAMPVIEDAESMPLFVAHERSFQPLLAARAETQYPLAILAAVILNYSLQSGCIWALFDQLCSLRTFCRLSTDCTEWNWKAVSCLSDQQFKNNWIGRRLLNLTICFSFF